MFMPAASASRDRLFSTISCSATAASSWMRACFWRVSIEHGAADFVEDGCHALLVGRIDDVTLERVDGGKLAPAVSRSDPVWWVLATSMLSAASRVASALVTASLAPGGSCARRAASADWRLRATRKYSLPAASP